MAAKIKEGMTGGQVADIIEQNFENLEDKFQLLSDWFDHLIEDLQRVLDDYQELVNDACGSLVTKTDEEDTTTDLGKIKFKDRAYDPDNFSGKGYKILRKNIVCDIETKEAKNILTQDMINEANTVYEIRYDFDLNGETITIPEGCTLKFNKGTLKNGFFSSTSILFTIDGYGCLLDVSNIPNNYLHYISMPILHVDPYLGDDSNIGTIESPFRTVREAMKYSNHVSIKRNTIVNTFDELTKNTESGEWSIISIKHALTLDSYGTGTNPIISGRCNLGDSTLLWVQSGDYYTIDLKGLHLTLLDTLSGLGQQVTISSENSEYCNFGIMCDYTKEHNMMRVRTKLLLRNNEYDLYDIEYGVNTDYSIKYSKLNSGALAYMREVSLGIFGIHANHLDYIHIKNLTVQYCGCSGIDGLRGYCSVENCEVYNIGGSVQGVELDRIVIYGNGIGGYNSRNSGGRVLLKNNTIGYCYDAGMSMQGSNVVHTDYIGNKIYNCHYGIEVFDNATQNVDCLIYENQIVNCNDKLSQWRYCNNGDPNSPRDYYGAIVVWTSTGNNCKIFNNLIINSPLLAITYTENLVSSQRICQLAGNTLITKVGLPVYKFGIAEYDNNYTAKENNQEEADRLENMVNISNRGNIHNQILITNGNFGISGNSTQRPDTDTNAGLQYFDTTLNKPIWWTGTKWVDATGADV